MPRPTPIRAGVAAPVAAVDPRGGVAGDPPVHELVGVGVTDAVGAETFEVASVAAPVQSPPAHVVVRGVVDDTRPAGALGLGVDVV